MTSGSKQVRFLGALLDLIIVGGGEDSDLYAPCHRYIQSTEYITGFILNWRIAMVTTRAETEACKTLATVHA